MYSINIVDKIKMITLPKGCVDKSISTENI